MESISLDKQTVIRECLKKPVREMLCRSGGAFVDAAKDVKDAFTGAPFESEGNPWPGEHPRLSHMMRAVTETCCGVGIGLTAFFYGAASSVIIGLANVD